MNEQQQSPAQPYAHTQPQAPAAQPVNTYMVMSVISLVVSGVSIFGILAVVFSALASSSLAAGNIPDAMSKASTAKIMAIISFVWAGLGILSAGLFFIIMIIAAAASS